jgi:NADPH-dependent 2,4-dienoyl-CoA reductase/sulfur reductase-like enzyme
MVDEPRGLFGAERQSTGFVVVGASLAGLRAVEAARREGYTGSITLVGQESHLPYDRPPLSKAFLSHNEEPQFYLTEQEIRDNLDVDIRLGEPATGLDPVEHIVTVGTDRIQYDKVLIATGATPRQLPHIPLLKNVFTLRTIEQAVAIRRAIGSKSHVLVIGAGFIGSEIASSARSMGAAVTIVEAAPVPLVRAVGEVVGRAISELHERNGTRLLCDVQIEEIRGAERIEAVRLSTGELLEVDVVIVGIGAAPATTWLAASGIALNPIDGGIICDRFLQTSFADVYAAGDVAHWSNGLMDSEMRLENWTSAAEQGAQAAVNALFPDRAIAHETVPYFWSDWYGSRIQFVGTAVAESVSFISGGLDGDRFVALYRTGDRLVGAAAVNEQRKIMKYRRLISKRGTWDEALELFPAEQDVHSA